VFVLVVSLWCLQLARYLDPDAPRAPPRVAGASMVAAPTVPSAAPPATRADMQAPRPAPTALSSVAAASAARAEAGQSEVCGFGKAPFAADDPYSLKQIPPAVRQRALDEIEAHLLANTDPQVRAAALLLAAKARGDGRSRIDTLARLAVASQDPLVYAIALEGCKGWTDGDAASCGLLSIAQWVRLDPDNAQPWLELAAQAQQQHDADAEVEAMRRAAGAHRSDAHAGLLASLVDRALDIQTPLLQRTLAASASWSIQASWGPPQTSQAYVYCAVDIDADPARRDTCEAIAETLSYSSTSVTDLGVGLAIAKKLGWPAQRLQALQQEHDAINEAGGAPLTGADFSCEAVDRMQAWIRQLGTRGERQAMRDVLARSGRSVEEWSAQYRRNFKLAEATAQTASLSVATDAAP
jgi:hypothetical protein